ncbi:MAG: DUF4389 domain-containing protein [Actinobacteria bacterium]|nr:DUF4389 domain-containing protein [Actinomycetota bacterium]
MSTETTYPARMEARLDTDLSRWLWLVKWVLLIPHVIVLVFLWLAFAVLWLVALVAIVFTGRYPRAIFEFNVGVLRWTWRVSYYGYGALGTDRYPPFTLADVPDYPARYEVAYPESLSRGLALVKWWLLAIPHYIVVALLVGGGAWFGWRQGHLEWSAGGGLIGILVLVAGVVLLFSGSYPGGIFDLVVGLNRWALRVAAYAALLTDDYPPFRLDLGGAEPGVTAPLPPPPSGPAARARPGGWTAGRVVAVVVGALLSLTAMGLVGGGGVALWADAARRDADGFLTTPTQRFATGGHALVEEGIDVRVQGPNWLYASAIVGEVRLRVTASSGGPVFVGIGPQADVDRYLAGVAHATVRDFAHPRYGVHEGGAPSTPPGDQRFWDVSSSGPGTMTLLWEPPPGSWTIVVMNEDGSAGVDVDADIGATVPALPWIGVGLLAGGAVLLAGGVLLLVLAARRAAAGPR